MTASWMRTDRMVFALLLVFCSGCGGNATKVAFKNSLMTKYKLDDSDLTNLQFYISSSITLTREVTAEYKAGMQNSKLVERDGKIIEEIQIPSGTSGVCIEPRTETFEYKYGFLNLQTGTSTRKLLYISFHPGTALRFEERSGGLWVIEHESRNSNNVSFFEENGGKWQCDTYSIQDRDMAYLQVDEDSLKKVEKKRRTLEGVKAAGSQ